MTAPPDRFSLIRAPNGVHEDAQMQPRSDGRWVRYDDHQAAIAALEAERNRLREALTELIEVADNAAWSANIGIMDDAIRKGWSALEAGQ